MNAYPKTLDEMEALFKDEPACLAYISALRWPSGFECPACGSTKGWPMGNGLMLCGNCRRQQSVLAGTLFHRTHLPMKTWFRAMWHLCAAKNGLSAQNLQRQIGLGSYNTAWLCLHKLRRVMVRPGRERLSGEVEVDETYVGGPAEGKRGRGAFGKQIVMVAVERKSVKDERGAVRPIMGRIRLEVIPDVQMETLEKGVEALVEPGSKIVTDGWAGYNSLEKNGYRRSIEIASREELADIALPNCHMVASLMKRWILGTLQGSVGAEHLQDYLNEFTFRFNRRSSRSRGLLFHRLMELAVSAHPVFRKDIIPQHIVGG
jgi:transposase-like protein